MRVHPYISPSGSASNLEPDSVDRIAVADVEEEMVGAAVLTVLEDLDQGEAQHILVETDGPLDIR
jgi:hypothetical protein